MGKKFERLNGCYMYGGANPNGNTIVHSKIWTIADASKKVKLMTHYTPNRSAKAPPALVKKWDAKGAKKSTKKARRLAEMLSISVLAIIAAVLLLVGSVLWFVSRRRQKREPHLNDSTVGDM